MCPNSRRKQSVGPNLLCTLTHTCDYRVECKGFAQLKKKKLGEMISLQRFQNFQTGRLQTLCRDDSKKPPRGWNLISLKQLLDSEYLIKLESTYTLGKNLNRFAL